MIAREYTDWLDKVAGIPEADLPCNVSTVAYAIKVALVLREENQALVEQLRSVCEAWPGQNRGQTNG